MGNFQVIAGSGHCGTMWLAHVLDAATGMKWYHELRHEMTGLPWHETQLYPPDDVLFENYWDRLAREIRLHGVGDANSWPVYMLPDVNEHWPIERVIYLSRNPVQQLHSLVTKSPVWSADKWPESAETMLYHLWAIAGEPGPNWDEWGRYERLCLLVKVNDHAPDWLRAQGLAVDDYTLEQLTSDVPLLRQLTGLHPDRVRKWQAYDLNRKVEGDRSPAALWAQWPDELREAFTNVCGVPT